MIRRRFTGLNKKLRRSVWRGFIRWTDHQQTTQQLRMWRSVRAAAALAGEAQP